MSRAIHIHDDTTGAETIVHPFKGFQLVEDVNGIITIMKDGKNVTGMTYRSLEAAQLEVGELLHIGMTGDTRGCDCNGTRDAKEADPAMMQKMHALANRRNDLGWSYDEFRRELTQYKMSESQRGAVLVYFRELQAKRP